MKKEEYYTLTHARDILNEMDSEMFAVGMGSRIRVVKDIIEDLLKKHTFRKRKESPKKMRRMVLGWHMEELPMPKRGKL